MKKTNLYLLLAACAVGVVAFSTKLTAADSPAPVTTTAMANCCNMGVTTVADASTNAIPDKLKTCPVSGDKLGGDMGGPYVFTYKGQEVKLCCQSCKKDFDKNPDKYMSMIRAGDKK